MLFKEASLFTLKGSSLQKDTSRMVVLQIGNLEKGASGSAICGMGSLQDRPVLRACQLTQTAGFVKIAC